MKQVANIVISRKMFGCQEGSTSQKWEKVFEDYHSTWPKE